MIKPAGHDQHKQRGKRLGRGKPYPRERGAVTALFVMIVMCLVGAISLSMYSGQLVNERIKSQIAVDASAIGTATHAAQGLNMIAANNLSIGGALHVSGAMHVMGLYLMTFKLFTYTWAEYISDRIKIFLGEADEFQQWMDRMSLIGGQFMRSASGMTSLNQYITEYWLLMASARGLELASLNKPGSMAVPLQRNPNPSGLPQLAMGYAGIQQMQPKDTICHTFKSSLEATPWKGWGPSTLNRHNPIHWLAGPIDSTDVPILGRAAELSSQGGAFIDEFINIFKMQYGFSACGSGLVSPLIKILKALIDLMMKDQLLDKLALFQENTEDWDDWMHDLKPSERELKKAACESKKKCSVSSLSGCVKKVLTFICKFAANIPQTVNGIWTSLKTAKSGALFGETLEDNGIQRTIILTKALKESYESDKSICYPYKNPSTGEEKCLPLSKKRYYCPAIQAKLLHMNQLTGEEAGPIRDISLRHNENVDDIDCGEWDIFADESQDYEPALTINNWSKQADKWVHTTGGLAGAFSGIASAIKKSVKRKAKKLKSKSRKFAQKKFKKISKSQRKDIAKEIRDTENLIDQGSSATATSSNPDEDRMHGIGFHVIAPEGTNLNVAITAFRRSKQFISLLISPTRMRDQQDLGCPAIYSQTIADPNNPNQQIQVCEVAPISLLGANNTDTLSEDTEAGVDSNLGSSGIQKLTGTGGRLESQWLRTQFVISQSRVSFEPSSDDPTSIRATSQLFWPAFRPRLATVTLLGDALRMLRRRSTPNRQPSTVEHVATTLP